MWNSRSYYEKLLEGWERSETSSGIPYYINHKSEVTQWDHPFLLKTMEELADYDSVKYAAYRSAMKLRFIQKRLKLELVSLDSITRIFKQRGHNGPTEGLLDCIELENILLDVMFEAARSDHTRRINAEQSAELLLNWLLNLYDENRTGQVRSLSVKIALVALSTARLADKYKFFFQQISDHNNYASRKKMALFLHDLMQVAEVVHEDVSFGCQNVAASIDSCMERAMSSQGVSIEVFLDWLFREPQTLVWLPTMHRMAASESVKHEAKCNICKIFPIIGFRYRCLKCFNLDICQQCFLTGRVTKKHKLKHPTQEYCVAAGSKDDTKAFIKTVKNNLSKKSKEKSKRPRFLPVDGSSEYGGGIPDRFSPEPPEPDIHRMLSKAAKQLAEREHLAPPGKVSKVIQTDPLGASYLGTVEEKENYQNLHLAPGSFTDSLKERENIIHSLEDENSNLLREIERMQTRLDSTSSQSDSESGSEDELVRLREERLDVEQRILHDHNQQLERQLERLRGMVNSKDEVDVAKQSQSYSQRVVNNLQQKSHSPAAPGRLPPPPPSGRLVNPQIARLQSQHHASTPLQKGPQSVLPPPPPPMHDLSSFYSNSPLRIPLTENRPNMQRNVAMDPRTLHFNLNEQSLSGHHSGLSVKMPNARVNQTELNFSQYPWDEQSDMSHFSLPAPDQSTRISDEQAELDDILQRLQDTYPANMSRSAVGGSGTPVDSNEVFAAANRIGAAMSNFAHNW